MENSDTIPVVASCTTIEPCSAYYDGARYGRRLGTKYGPVARQWPLQRLLRRIGAHQRPFGAHLDEVVSFPGNVLAVRGWAASRNPLSHVRLFCDGHLVGSALLDRERDDVLAAFPRFREQPCGFYFCCRAPTEIGEEVGITVDLLDGPKRIGRMSETYAFA